MKIADNKGVTTAEIIVSIIIIILFTSLITSSFYSYYMTIQSKNRRTIATNLLVDIIENTEMMNYDEINQDSVNNLIETINTQKGYTVTATIRKYNETEGNINKKDLIKILKVTVSYKVGDKQETNEITRLIKR